VPAKKKSSSSPGSRSGATLAQLEAARQLRGAGSATKVEKLINSLRRISVHDVSSLLRRHDALLFLRAFPQNPAVAAKADSLLAKTAEQVTRLRASGADLTHLDSEQFSGIAGTRLSDTFTYEVAVWLARRYPGAVQAAWDFDAQARLLAAALPRFIPLLDDDSLVEADTPFDRWLASAAGKTEPFLWLLDRFEKLPIATGEKTELYDALALEVHWELGDSPASRTRARRHVNELFCHPTPLIRRNQVSLAEECASTPLPIRKLGFEEGEQVLDMCREAVTVRYRELYGTTRGDPNHVYLAEAGRGVQIFLWGLPPDRRLPLRSYHAGFTLKNGVPINYIEGISLFEWMEVGFNTFYAYRDGETAWIYSKVLHFLQQLTGVRTISVYPYQLGHENEEAIQSGAFWFYRKLGFRPGRRDLLALTEKEERRMTADPRHRTTPRTLRKLAAGHVFYDCDPSQRGAWDTFSTRNLGFAVGRRTAEEFAGDWSRMRDVYRAALATILTVDPSSWDSPAQTAFDNFAALLSLIPEVARWLPEEKQALLSVIRAKTGAEETEYLRLLQQHQRLRDAVLRLGSAPSVPF
jgi:hypothetical protein